jgi:hypothetical protein
MRGAFWLCARKTCQAITVCGTQTANREDAVSEQGVLNDNICVHTFG